jgi:diadenosine tetraphosphate (Ap4A) HIT family hydrolase
VKETEGSSDCLFCNVLAGPAEILPWHDQPLVRVPDVGAVIAGLGAFVPGYVLVFPEQHIESRLRMSSAPHQAFLELLWTTVERVAAIFGSPTVFEHGTCKDVSVRRSACLDHAHLHIIPGCYDLAKYARRAAEMTHHQVSSFTSHDSGYLYLQEPAAEPVYTEDPGISQFFRRQIAGEIGEADDWDYLLFPRLDNVRETIAKFRAHELVSYCDTIDLVTNDP